MDCPRSGAPLELLFNVHIRNLDHTPKYLDERLLKSNTLIPPLFLTHRARGQPNFVQPQGLSSTSAAPLPSGTLVARSRRRSHLGTEGGVVEQCDLDPRVDLILPITQQRWLAASKKDTATNLELDERSIVWHMASQPPLPITSSRAEVSHT